MLEMLKGVTSVKENQKHCCEILEAIVFLAFLSNISLKKCLVKIFKGKYLRYYPIQPEPEQECWAVDCNMSR